MVYDTLKVVTRKQESLISALPNITWFKKTVCYNISHIIMPIQS